MSEMKIRFLIDKSEVRSLETSVIPNVGDIVKAMTPNGEISAKIDSREWDVRYGGEEVLVLHAHSK